MGNIASQTRNMYTSYPSVNVPLSYHFKSLMLIQISCTAVCIERHTMGRLATNDMGELQCCNWSRLGHAGEQAETSTRERPIVNYISCSTFLLSELLSLP